MRQRIRKRPMADINVVPYIDVMLVLLIIFMITAPLLTQGVKVDLPKTSSTPIDSSDNEPVIINVNAKGEYFINNNDENDTPVDLLTLIEDVIVILKYRTEKDGVPPPFLVGGDRDVPYGRIVELMASLQNAGVEGVGLLTEPLEQ